MPGLSLPFRLHASNSTPDSAVQPSAELPSEVAGQPAIYFWKEMIHCGNYAHPVRGYSLAVDSDRLDRWEETGRQMLSAGVAIPINCDHSDRARDVVGYIKEMKRDGDRLLALCQFIGEDAALTAARNLVSVGIDPDFTDGQARHWGEAIVHLALTPVPVVPNQGHFIAASMPAGSDDLILVDEPEDTDDDDDAVELPAVNCTEDQFNALRELIPDGSDLSAEDCVDRIIEYLQSLAKSQPDPQADQLRNELSTANQKIAELSARIPSQLSEESAAALAESVTAKFDSAVARGGLSPAARDRLVSVLVTTPDGKANLIALSRAANPGGSNALAMSIADILMDSPPMDLGEKTGLQALNRAVPGEGSSPMDQLRQYMTKVASVSG